MHMKNTYICIYESDNKLCCLCTYSLYFTFGSSDIPFSYFVYFIKSATSSSTEYLQTELMRRRLKFILPF